MDTEEGVEVVWNEVLFSERKISDIQHVCIIQSSSFSGYTCHRLQRTNDEQCLRNPIAILVFLLLLLFLPLKINCSLWTKEHC